jgi:hypothetical protein
MGAACIGAGLMWPVIRAASAYEPRDYSGLKHHAKVHTFRIARRRLQLGY